MNMATRPPAQKPIELILTRQLATSLAMPIFLVDANGTLVFYNEPAERILGRRFDETGEMSAAEWVTAFAPTDAAGRPLGSQALPLTIAHVEHRPAHAELWIRGFDNVARQIEATAFPLMGPGGKYVGALTIFWETGE